MNIEEIPNIDKFALDDKNIVLPDTSNEIRFHGILEEFKKYLPEFYEKICAQNAK